MDFGEFFALHEALAIDSERAELKGTAGLLSCPFEYGGVNYEVTLQQSDKAESWGVVPDVWSIGFKGPRGYSLTRSAGTSGSAIYSRMLGCVKKLLETQTVTGLMFSPADQEMVVPYDLFARSYLMPDPPRGAGFKQINLNFFVRKSWLEENRDKLPSWLDKAAEMVDQEQARKVRSVKEIKAIKKQIAQAGTPEEKAALRSKMDQAQQSEFDRVRDFTKSIGAVRRGTEGAASAGAPAQSEEQRNLAAIGEGVGKLFMPGRGLTGPLAGATFFHYTMPSEGDVDLIVGRPMPERMRVPLGELAAAVAASTEASGTAIKQLAMRLHDGLKEGRPWEVESRMKMLHPDLKAAVQGLGVLPKAGLAVARAARGVASYPGELRNYYMGGKQPAPGSAVPSI